MRTLTITAIALLVASSTITGQGVSPHQPISSRSASAQLLEAFSLHAGTVQNLVVPASGRSAT